MAWTSELRSERAGRPRALRPAEPEVGHGPSAPRSLTPAVLRTLTFILKMIKLQAVGFLV